MNAAFGVRFFAGAFFAAAFLAGAFFAVAFLAGAAFFAGAFLATTFFAGAFFAAAFLAGAFFAGAFFAAFFAVAMIDFLLEVDEPPVENCTLTGSADAKGEMGRIQAEKAVFHWEMLLFYPRAKPVFPLERVETHSGKALRKARFPSGAPHLLQEEAPSTSRRHRDFLQ